MRSFACWTTVLLPIQLLLEPESCSAQAAVAWAGAMGTPVGALPTVLPASSGSGTRIGLQVARWGKAGRAANIDAGISLYRPLARATAFGVTVGQFVPGCSGCDAVTMAGIDYVSTGRTLRPPRLLPLRLGVATSAGYGREPRKSFLAFAVGPTVIGAEPGGSWSAFLAPRLVLGGVRDGSESDNGFATAVAGGASWNPSERLNVAAAIQRFLVGRTPISASVAVSTSIGGRDRPMK